MGAILCTFYQLLLLKFWRMKPFRTCSHHMISSMLTGMEQIMIELEVVASSFSFLCEEVHGCKRLLYERNIRALLRMREGVVETDFLVLFQDWLESWWTDTIHLHLKQCSLQFHISLCACYTHWCDQLSWSMFNHSMCLMVCVQQWQRRVHRSTRRPGNKIIPLRPPYQRAILASDVFSLRSDASSGGWWWSLEEQKHCYFGCKYSDLQFPAKTPWNRRLVCGYRLNGSK